MIDLLIKYPTRSRPDLFKRILTEYVNNLSGTLQVKFVISMDIDDDTCNNNPMRYFLENMKSKVDLEYYYGTSKNKIDACNRDIPKEGWKVCLLVSDDMVVKQKHYDKIIFNDMKTYYPDYDGILNYNAHTPAFTQHIPGRGSLVVLSILGKKYFDRFGYIYNPIYKSLFADDEQTRIGRKLNKITDINNRIISHEWSSINDDLRKQTESLDSIDRQIFKERLQKGLI
jgi:hypothetical protein